MFLVASFAASAADTDFKFQLILMANGVDKGAADAGFRSPHSNDVNLGSNVYEASDGQRLSVRYIELRSEEEARRYFDWELGRSADRVINEGDDDSRGTVVGLRSEALLKSGGFAVMWTSGATFRSTYAQDLKHAGALEKQYKAGRVGR